MRAYVMIKFEPGVDLDKIQHAMHQPGVERIDLLMGPFDAIVTLEVESAAVLTRLLPLVRTCPGIQDSVTYPVLA